MLKCEDDKLLHSFCWKRLALTNFHDWEVAYLIETLLRTNGFKDFSKKHRLLIEQYLNRPDLPLSQANAARVMITEGQKRVALSWIRSLSPTKFANSKWLQAVFLSRSRKGSRRRSLRAISKWLLCENPSQSTLLPAYLAGRKLRKADLKLLPPSTSPYNNIILNNLTNIGHPTSNDEIAPLLKRIFKVRLTSGFDFRIKLGSINPNLYTQALRSLQQASLYFETSPSHFVNHMHNFNHVLWYFLLVKHSIVSVNVKWNDLWRAPYVSAARPIIPTVAKVFDDYRKARNTNLATHPIDDKKKRFTKLVSFQQRNQLSSKLRSAYHEFIAKA